MSTRSRIFLAAVLLVVLPTGILAGLLRARLLHTVTSDFVTRWHDDLVREQSAVADDARHNRRQLRLLAEAAADDNRLRLALSGERDDLAPYLRDYAGGAARLAGLPFLALLDAEGRILSSAHYRNEFGADDADLLAAFEDLEGRPPTPHWFESPVLRDQAWPAGRPSWDHGTLFHVERTATGPELAMLARERLRIRGRRFHLVGGRRTIARRLVSPGGRVDGPASPSAAELTRWGAAAGRAWIAREVPYVQGASVEPAALVFDRSRDALQVQRRQVDQLVALLFVAVVAGAFLLAAWLSGRLARPLVELTDRAARIDLDAPAVDLRSERSDEVGTLGGVLDGMVARLRAGARRLADAERRATLGEVSRQVNHDLRNGITPVRNVVRHLAETAARTPDQLVEVFRGRQGTLESSLGYLEDLAGRYGRLAPEPRHVPCDLADLARQAAAAHQGVTVFAADDVPPVLADPVSLRRILDNLLRNAREASEPDGPPIAVRLERADDPDLGPQCRLAVRDRGCGMAPEVLAHVLDDFFTTKPGGSGLGLSNVRRLAGDAGGRVDIHSEPGEGTTVTIVFPAAEAHP